MPAARVKDSWAYLGLGGVIFALTLAGLILREGAVSTALGVLVVGLVSSYLIFVSRQQLAIDEQSVSWSTVFNTYRIDWSEVQRAYADREMSAIVLEGNGKRLVLYGPQWFRPDDGATVFSLLFDRLNELGIPLERSQAALLRRMRGTKLPKTFTPRQGAT